MPPVRVRRPPIAPRPGVGVLVWLLAWGVVIWLRHQTDLLNLTMVLVMASALSALWLSPVAALCASLVSGVLFNYAFVPPKGTFSLAFDQHHVFLLLTVAALSWIIARLMAGQRDLAGFQHLLNRRTHRLFGPFVDQVQYLRKLLSNRLIPPAGQTPCGRV